jgi:hypothetical protein
MPPTASGGCASLPVRPARLGPFEYRLDFVVDFEVECQPHLGRWLGAGIVLLDRVSKRQHEAEHRLAAAMSVDRDRRIWGCFVQAHVSVTVTNRGRAPVTIDAWGFELPGDKSNIVQTLPLPWLPPPPHRLEAKAEAQWMMALADLQRRCAQRGSQ